MFLNFSSVYLLEKSVLLCLEFIIVISYCNFINYYVLMKMGYI